MICTGYIGYAHSDCHRFYDTTALCKMAKISSPALKAVQKLSDNNALTISWEDGDIQMYPYVWLRDNCQCRGACWNLLEINGPARANLNCDVTAINVDIDQSIPTCLNVTWSDGHKSEYPSNWLRSHRFDSTEADPIFHPTLRYWGCDVGNTQLKVFKFNDILSSEKILYEWLSEIKELGITIVKGAPIEKGQVQRLGDRVDYIQWTIWGPTFQVETRNDDGAVTYQSGFLPLHTDLSYATHIPEVLLLHCIKQDHGEGGESILADGHKAAEELKDKHPDSFKILTSTALDLLGRGDVTAYYGKYHLKARHPVIGLDDSGEISDITYSPHSRSATMRCPTSQVEAVYRALQTFHNILYQPENLFKYKLEEGDIVCINNRRVLHGRTAFNGTCGRHLEGGYLGWDTINSRMKIIQEQLSVKEVEEQN